MMLRAFALDFKYIPAIQNGSVATATRQKRHQNCQLFDPYNLEEGMVKYLSEFV